jgi:hypothetical protein
MKNVGQIQAAHEPAKYQIGSAHQKTYPWSQLNRRRIYASQQVKGNDQISHEAINFHRGSPVAMI